MGSLGIIITALTLAAKYEPLIAAVLGALVPALKEFHTLHGDTMMLSEIDRLFKQHGLDPSMVSAVLPIAAPGPEGQSQPQV